MKSKITILQVVDNLNSALQKEIKKWSGEKKDPLCDNHFSAENCG